MAIDINRGTTGVVTLPESISAEIWGDTLSNSVVQQLARRTEMPAGGTRVQMITGDPEAGWVDETDEKPVSDATFGSKFLQPYKLAVIELFSDEFRRDKNALYNELIRRLPYALGRKFDRTVFGYDAAPGQNFDTLAAAPEFLLDGTIDPYFAALGSVSDAKGDITGWAVSPAVELEAMQINDGMDRPLLINSLNSDRSIGSILGRPVYKHLDVAGTTLATEPATGSEVAGFAGNWNEAVWGYVDNISFDINDRGSVTKGDAQINLWQRNMFAVRVEVEIGFGVRDVNRFAKLITVAGTDGL